MSKETLKMRNMNLRAQPSALQIKNGGPFITLRTLIQLLTIVQCSLPL